MDTVYAIILGLSLTFFHSLTYANDCPHKVMDFDCFNKKGPGNCMVEADTIFITKIEEPAPYRMRRTWKECGYGENWTNKKMSDSFCKIDGVTCTVKRIN